MIRPVLRKILGRDLLGEHRQSLQRLELKIGIASALARAAATAPLRALNPCDPLTWEFSGFSQHGEDGILDYLCAQLSAPSRFFFEIGAADGVQNCTAWLAYARHYGGVWIEGDPELFGNAVLAVKGMNWGVYCVNRYVDRDCIAGLLKMCPHTEPDVFSLDIDSIDYHIARRVLELDLRPKVWVVEYNSAFGPERSVTVPYAPRFNRWAQDPSGLYYGCSIASWRRLFDRYGYSFVTVESSGTNAFFINPAFFPPGFTENLRGAEFRDNEGDLNGATRPHRDEHGDDVLPHRDWRTQYERIAKLPLAEVG